MRLNEKYYVSMKLRQQLKNFYDYQLSTKIYDKLSFAAT